jgi:hypothetical protein
VIGLAASAGAAPLAPASLCGSANPPAGLALTDVKLEGVNATDCYGVQIGNTTNTDINAIDALSFGDTEDWGTEIKDAAPGLPTNGTGSFYGVNWTLSSSAGKEGTWNLSFLDTVPSKLNFTADILVLLKGSNRYAAYYFNDFLFDSTSNTGVWDVNFVNNGGQTPDLSHLSVYFRDGNAVCPADCQGGQQDVPEPVTLALLGTGLFGVGVARRRRLL